MDDTLANDASAMAGVVQRANGNVAEAARATRKQSRKARKAAVKAALRAAAEAERGARKAGKKAVHAAEATRDQAAHLVDRGRHRIAS